MMHRYGLCQQAQHLNGLALQLCTDWSTQQSHRFWKLCTSRGIKPGADKTMMYDVSWCPSILMHSQLLLFVLAVGNGW